MTIYNSILIGVPVKSFDLAAASPADGQIYALPARASLLEWQFFFGTNPDAVEISIQTSLDAIHWNEVANSTSVTGASGNFVTAAKFIRAVIVSITNGDEVTVIFNAAIPTQEYNITNNFPANMNGILHQATITLDDDQIKALPTTPVVIVPATEVLDYDGYPTQIPIVVNAIAQIDASFGAYTNINALGTIGLAIGSDWSLTISTLIFTNGNLLNQKKAFSLIGSPLQLNGLTGDYVGDNDTICGDGFIQDNAIALVANNDLDGDFTGGNALNNLMVSLSYYILDVATGQFI